MKKTILVLAMLLAQLESRSQTVKINALLSPNFAFPTINDDVYSPPKISPNSGYNSKTISSYDVYRQVKGRPGLDLGIELCINLEDRLHLQTGTNVQWLRYRIEHEVKDSYSNSSSTSNAIATVSDNGINTNLFVVSLPLGLKYNLGRNISIFSSIQFSSLLHTQQEYKRLMSSYSFHEDFSQFESKRWGAIELKVWEERVSDTEGNGFTTFNASFNLGMSYQLNNKLHLRGYYSKGLRNLYSNSLKDAINTDFKSKMNIISFGLAYEIQSKSVNRKLNQNVKTSM